MRCVKENCFTDADDPAKVEIAVGLPQSTEPEIQQYRAHGGQQIVKIQELQLEGEQDEAPGDTGHGLVPRGDGLHSLSGGRKRLQSIHQLVVKVVPMGHSPSPPNSRIRD